MRAFATLLAIALCLVGSRARASDFWDEVKDPGLGPYRTRVAAGWRSFAERHFEAAVQAAEAAIAAEPRRCEAYLLRGRALGELGRAGDAADAFERALARDPTCADDPEQGGAAARTAAAAGRLDLAATLLERAVARMRDGPARRLLYALYGDVRMALGPEHLHDAILAYREVLRHQVDVRASLGLALALRRAGRIEEARVVAANAVAHGRVDALVARLPLPAAEKAARLAVALEAAGDAEGARRAWREASEGEIWRGHAERELAAHSAGGGGGRR